MQIIMCLFLLMAVHLLVDSDSPPAWSAWSEWSGCSSTCGSGEQSRYRMCDSPSPEPDFGGELCHGHTTQKRYCELLCPDSIPMTPLYTPKGDSACACGCHMTSERGEIIASGRCTGTSKWLISVQKNYIINLNFSFLSFYQDKQWVKVKNGGSPDSDLIAFTDGRSNIHHVASTTNQMLIEFYTEPDSSDFVVYPLKPTKPVHVYGFIAEFTSNMTDINSGGPSMSSLQQRSSSTTRLSLK